MAGSTAAENQEHRNQIWNVEAPVERGELRKVLAAAHREVQVIDMKVDDIEIIFSLQDLFDET